MEQVYLRNRRLRSEAARRLDAVRAAKHIGFQRIERPFGENQGACVHAVQVVLPKQKIRDGTDRWIEPIGFGFFGVGRKRFVARIMVRVNRAPGPGCQLVVGVYRKDDPSTIWTESAVFDSVMSGKIVNLNRREAAFIKIVPENAAGWFIGVIERFEFWRQLQLLWLWRFLWRQLRFYTFHEIPR